MYIFLFDKSLLTRKVQFLDFCGPWETGSLSPAAGAKAVCHAPDTHGSRCGMKGAIVPAVWFRKGPNNSSVWVSSHHYIKHGAF